MYQFKKGETVITIRDIHAGPREDGQFVCKKGTIGQITEIERKEWDGVKVKLATGIIWWFKPTQLRLMR